MYMSGCRRRCRRCRRRAGGFILSRGLDRGVHIAAMDIARQTLRGSAASPSAALPPPPLNLPGPPKGLADARGRASRLAENSCWLRLARLGSLTPPFKSSIIP